MGELGSGCPGRAGGGEKEGELGAGFLPCGGILALQDPRSAGWGQGLPALPQLTSRHAAGAAVGPGALPSCVPLAFKSSFPGQMLGTLDSGRIRQTQRVVLSWVCDG